jgi:maltose alpha-D-glucosyltransferase/alpha-amylase
MATDFLTDPRWYKDAVIYELHVRSFYDSDDDGFGDFQGLREKLPYLESLGVNTLWLLPFLESPLKDDGYDTADYFKVLPVHGDLDDFKAFLDDAHARGMRVITELVLNHTSDQHPWFQAARDPSSDKHDWYVWSETDKKYEDVRIIFTDTEDSNWSWDQKAQKYYWHRFFSHQPDLNYDNPAVRQTMKEVMFFWLDMGVDGLRLDAVPYLFEREGTNSENLPATIDYIKELRAAVEERYGPGKILLAEANQWPEDTLPYFGEDDDGNSTGVQMAFNFPIMPRMYMALRRENRRPLVEMLAQTNDIPDDAQWAIFLRNHDELTLEMVTDEERDYMYHEYAAYSRFRINVGIRRRLAPLLGGERRRIELMNALLLSLKGSPIIYYGDEIGMGDDPFLGDRNGVRTPMQWSQDKNGGFSRAPHHQLFMPPINRGPYSYEFVNVEDAENDPHSLLNFMKRLLALRKQHEQVFGRGTFDLVPLDNQSVLAFVREYEGKKILVMANLSRFAQSVHLPVSDTYDGMVPVELFSKASFPVFGQEPYHMVIGPHQFYWFVLEPEEKLIEEAEQRTQQRLAEAGPNGQLAVIPVDEGLENLLIPTMARGRGPEQFENMLPGYIAEQRWFGAKGETIERVQLEDAVRLQADPTPIYLSVLSVERADTTDLYVLPLTITHDGAEDVLDRHPGAALAWIDEPGHDGYGLLHDAVVVPDFWTTLFRWWQQGGKGRSLKGLYVAEPMSDIHGANAQNVHLLTGEQSNSAAIVDDAYFVKLYRRLEQGTNPETELLDHLTATGFTFTPRLHGTVRFKRGRSQYTLGIVQEALPVDADGWEYALEVTGRFFERVAETKPPADPLPTDVTDPTPAWLDEVASEMLSMARVLGVRTAELHLALADATSDDLAPIDGTPADTQRLADHVRAEAEQTRHMLAEKDRLDAVRADGERSGWQKALRRLDALADTAITSPKIRLHGDYHLGQVLQADGEFYILDFEGEPARPLEERRERGHALRDVAGMLRSLDYAILAAWREHANGHDEFTAWADVLTRWCETLFLQAYLDTTDEAAFVVPAEHREQLLWTYLFEKVLYEVRYELNHRPDWVWLPLRGLNRLLDEAQLDIEPLALDAPGAPEPTNPTPTP